MSDEDKKTTTAAKPVVKAPATEKVAKEPAAVKTDVEKTPTKSDAAKTNETEQADDSRARLSNSEFFSRDILGASQRDRLIRPIKLRSRTAKALYTLIYDRLDTYLHRTKEIATLTIARDTNEEMQKIINNRLIELETYVNKRHAKVKGLYDAATAIEAFASDSASTLEVDAGFSTGYGNRLLSTIIKIDEACYMAGYLEMTGQFDIRQEANLTSELYRKNIQISRGLMVFIGRSIIGIRRKMRSQREVA
ncbi:hypothetical protein [Thiomicrorhabdus aquaedulcis]|uniref:hypothetical protein n=1 Tax=Thiomicrorhabdus aquaedulcis TaxID=2211106 RepID=UPI000FDBD7E5|nr:hypothetical protein [Thiomicrorhabdus aquaedulcis]